MNGLAEEFSGEITVLRLNAAEPENEQLMGQYGLRGHPSFALLNSNNQVAQTFFGPQPAEDMRAAIRAILPGNK